MSEPIDVEGLLRDALGTAPPPRLTPTFTERVTERLRPRRLRAGGRRTLRWFILAAGAVSVAVMRSQGIDWRLIAASLALTAALFAVVRPRLR